MLAADDQSSRTFSPCHYRMWLVGGGMGLEEEEKALARGQVPKSESFRKQRSVGCFKMADSHIYIITKF